MHLLSVVFNLLDNALKYSKGKCCDSSGHLKKTKNTIVLKVTDNGIGIPQNIRKSI